MTYFFTSELHPVDPKMHANISRWKLLCIINHAQHLPRSSHHSPSSHILPRNFCIHRCIKSTHITNHHDKTHCQNQIQGSTSSSSPKASAAVNSKVQKVTPVNHSYTDWSNLIHISRATEFLEMLNTFPAKLHKILSSPSNEDIIAWSPHGRSFKVLNAVCFMKEVVPEHFSFTKMESFHRDS